jgi:hypothetical protein
MAAAHHQAKRFAAEGKEQSRRHFDVRETCGVNVVMKNGAVSLDRFVHVFVETLTSKIRVVHEKYLR